MRVIGGKYKHRRFDVPRTFKARPTTDFAKENLFNVLENNYIDFSDGVEALDLFAGTGSITLELLSRGCNHVTAVERDVQHAAFIRSVLAKLGETQAQVFTADALRFLKKARQTYGFIFADPPYALREMGRLPEMVFSSDLLAGGGLFVLEHGSDVSFASMPQLIDHRKYGSVNFSFFRATAP